MIHNPHSDFTERFTAEIVTNLQRMRRYAYYLCRDRELADDITHDACVNLFKSPKAIACLKASGPVKFGAYAMTAVSNAHKDYIRAPQQRAGRSEVILPDDEGHRVFRVNDRAETTVTSLDLQNALMQLSDDDRLMIYLRYYEGHGIAEAAQEATGLTGTRAFRRHTQILEKLRQLLNGPGGE